MKQKSLNILLFSFLFGMLNISIGQNYLDVPPDPNFSKDYLNNIIFGDTTATGDRVEDRVYRLEIGEIYYFNNTIKTNGWDLKIIAEGTATPEFSKAIILTGKNDEGKQPARFAEVQGDVLFENLYFSCVTDNNKQMGDLARVFKDEAVITMNNCYVEWLKAHVFRVYGLNSSVYIKDSYINNTSVTGGVFNGKLLGFEDNPINEVIIQNITITNMQGVMIKGRFNTMNHFVFDHNTVVNTTKWPFHFEYWTNASVTNNIFYNVSSYGETVKDASNQDLDGQIFGMINLFGVPDSLLSQVGMTSQGERKVDVRNNSYFFDQDVKDYQAKWIASDTLREEPWMNERTQSWFDDDAGYPNLNVEAPITEDIGFVSYPTADSMVIKMDQIRTDGKKTTWFWVDDDGDKVGNLTDRPHDLTYSTSSAAYTAGDDGFPIGDLNWFPNKKSDWITGVEEISSNVPSEYTLSQNYPNPFNPTTNINFSIPEKGMVTLRVFNVLGQQVAQLVNQELNVGTHKVDFDATELTSGIYFYTLESGSFTQTQKMMLLK